MSNPYNVSDYMDIIHINEKGCNLSIAALDIRKLLLS